MTTRRRSAIGLAVVVMAVAALSAGPACTIAAWAQAPAQGQLSPGPAEPAFPPPTSPSVEIADTKLGFPGADAAYNTQLDEYLVVWREPDDIWGRRVTSRGKLLGQPFLIERSADSGYSGVRVAYDSQRNRYLVVWVREGPTSASSQHGRFVPAVGPNPSVTAFIIDSNFSPTGVGSLVYALSQDDFFLVWYESAAGTLRQITWGRRIPADGGGPLPPFVIAQHATDSRRRADVAYNLVRNEYLVTVDDGDKANENVYGTRLTAGGTVLGGGEFGIAGWPDDEFDASVAACPDGDQYLVVWYSYRPQDRTDGIYAVFVSGDGSPGDVVQPKSRTNWEWRSADAACGVTSTLRQAPRYLVAWAEDTAQPSVCRARQVYLLGTMDHETVYLGGECSDVALAGGAMNWLAVFVSGSKVLARIVGNTRPEAYFTVTPQEGDSTTDFWFDASGSTDVTNPTGMYTRWDWENDGVYDTARVLFPKTASHRFTLAAWQSTAVFTIQLEVADVLGATDETTGQVTVYNAPPSAVVEVEPASGNTTTTFRYDASGSSDPESGALQYRWDWQADGTYDTDWGTDAQREATYRSPGTYSVRVQVRDNWEQTDSQSRTVVVGEGANTPPTAAFSVTPSSGDTTTVFAFDASGSTDAEDGAPSAFRWDWQDDGAFDTAWSASPTANHTFPTAGTYTVRLEVRDSGGLTDDATRTVLVAQLGNLELLYAPLVLQGFP